MSKFSFSRGDLFGGITAGVVALPLALAFGIQSGLGAIAGLYGAIFLGMLASVFGGTPSQISGPTGPMTVVTASLVALVISTKGSLEAGMGIILVTFALAGLFQVVLGLLKAGQYIRYIPYPVLSGFMSGIGIIIISLQIFPLLGQTSPAGVAGVFANLGQALGNINWPALLLAGLTIAVIYLFPYLTRAVPGTLVAMVAVSLLNYLLHFEVPLIGEIPEGLPGMKAGFFAGLGLGDLMMAVVPALTLAGLGSLDTLLTSVVADNVTRSRHHSNRELVGQGIGNFVSALFGGIPGAGATMRTLVNIRSGGRGPLSGVIHGLFLLAILLGLGSMVSHIPNAVLAGILVTVGINIIDRKGLADILHIPRADAVTLVIVLLLTVFVDLLQAVGVGMIIASILFMKRAGDMVDKGTVMAESTLCDKEIPWEDEKDLHPNTLQKIYIQRLDGPVFFGAINRFRQSMSTVPPHAELVIIRMRRVPFMDQSGLYAMETAVRDLLDRGIRVAFTIVQPQPMYMFRKINLVPGMVPEELCFPDFEQCAAWINTEYGNGMTEK